MLDGVLKQRGGHVAAVAQLALAAPQLVGQQWLWAGYHLVFAVLLLLMPRLAAWDARRAGHSAEVNRRLAEGG